MIKLFKFTPVFILLCLVYVYIYNTHGSVSNLIYLAKGSGFVSLNVLLVVLISLRIISVNDWFIIIGAPSWSASALIVSTYFISITFPSVMWTENGTLISSFMTIVVLVVVGFIYKHLCKPSFSVMSLSVIYLILLLLVLLKIQYGPAGFYNAIPMLWSVVTVFLLYVIMRSYRAIRSSE